MSTHNAIDNTLWADAFDIYKHRTGIDLRNISSNFALHLHSCDSEDSVLDALEKMAAEFGGYRQGSLKWHKFRQKLKPVITAVTVFIDVAAEGAASKSVPGGKSVFVAVGVLLKATQGVSEKFDALVDLFESLGLFLRQLKIRSDVPLGNESKIVVVEILVEILKALALATQMMKKNRIQHFVRELFKADDMKAVLDRLNKLTTIQSRMTVAEMLTLVNQGQAWQAETNGLLGQIEEATSSLQRQNTALLARFSVLPDDIELRLASIVEQRMNERYLSATGPRAPVNVVRTDYAEGMEQRVATIVEQRVATIVEQGIQRMSERSLSVIQPCAHDKDYVRLMPSRAHLNFLRRVICSLITLSADEQAMIRRDLTALLPVITTTGVTGIEGSTFGLSCLAAAINPTTAIGLYTQTIILYIATYIIWRLIAQLTRSIPPTLGIDTIVVIDIMGLEFCLPLERCATFEGFHSLIVECASGQHNKSAAKYVLSRAYEVADGSNSAVIYPDIWGRKVRAGMRLEMVVLLRRPSMACPWCGRQNTQALWIHCDCGRVFEVSAASQMGPRDTAAGEGFTAFTEQLPASESSQDTSLPPDFKFDFDSFAKERSAEDDQDELPSFRKVHVIHEVEHPPQSPLPSALNRTMSPKQVRWKLTVDEYAARDSPESWSTPLRLPPGNAALPSPPPLPPAPRPQRDLPLTTSLIIHPVLTPAYALQLDLSFPSAAFRGNPQLTQTLLDTPACTPPQNMVVVRIASGMYKTRLEMGHTGGGAVTVGDVLAQIQRLLRNYDTDTSIPPEAAPYAARRVATVNGFSAGISGRTQLAHVRAENGGGPRIVDRLLGHTLFAGLTGILGQPDNHWQLELGVPERYAA